MHLAYHRGETIVEHRVEGGMAAIGLSWEETTARLPDGIICACNNAADSVTISGDADEVNALVKTLDEEGIFARVVNTCVCFGMFSNASHLFTLLISVISISFFELIFYSISTFLHSRSGVPFHSKAMEVIEADLLKAFRKVGRCVGTAHNYGVHS